MAANRPVFGDEPIADTLPSQDDVLDAATAQAQGQLTYCAFPGASGTTPAMYTNGDCKYSQAAVVTRCTVQSSSSGRCLRRQFQMFYYRGGTADIRSHPEETCAYRGDVGDNAWHLKSFKVVTDASPRRTLYTAAAAHYANHDNCGVEKAAFYGRPVPFDVNENATATFVFEHFCPSGSSCGTFTSQTVLPISVGSV
jgi:hypothetical protein